MGAFAFDLLKSEDYTWLVLALVLTVAAMDIGGYFIGRRLGKRALAPVVSPKKTVEGYIAGIIVAIAVGAAFGWAPPFEFRDGLLIGVVVAIVGARRGPGGLGHETGAWRQGHGLHPPWARGRPRSGRCDDPRHTGAVDCLLVDGIAQLKPLSVLGVTGSIGTQTLEVAAHLGIPVSGIAAGRGSSELLQIGLQLPGASVVAVHPTDEEAKRLTEALGSRVAFGEEALLAMAATPGTVTVNGIVGAAGLAPTVAALEAGNRVALANKESLIAGGPVVVAAATSGAGEIIPVDSEHSALWQCLVGETADSVRRLILTASGGPVPRQERRIPRRGDHRAGSGSPHLVDGAQDHHRLRDVDEQGVRGH